MNGLVQLIVVLYCICGIFCMLVVGVEIMNRFRNPESKPSKCKQSIFKYVGKYIGTMIITVLITITLLFNACIWWYYLIEPEKDR